jgi:DNA-binding IclR family transcriptional regulator
MISIGVTEGAELVVDGRSFTHPDHPDGFYLGGSLFDRVTPDMRIWQEELFGPVTAVVRVPDHASALTLINSHRYGNGTDNEEFVDGMAACAVPIHHADGRLAACLFTHALTARKSLDEILRFVPRLRVTARQLAKVLLA